MRVKCLYACNLILYQRFVCTYDPVFAGFLALCVLHNAFLSCVLLLSSGWGYGCFCAVNSIFLFLFADLGHPTGSVTGCLEYYLFFTLVLDLCFFVCPLLISAPATLLSCHSRAVKSYRLPFLVVHFDGCFLLLFFSNVPFTQLFLRFKLFFPPLTFLCLSQVRQLFLVHKYRLPGVACAVCRKSNLGFAYYLPPGR